MNLGAFAVVSQVERALGSDNLVAVRGLGREMPGPAAIMAVSLLSLAGIPPLAGFAGKIFLLSAALEGGFVWLAIIAIINMAIGLYYYVAIIAEMYLKRSQIRITVVPGMANRAVLSVCVVGTLLLGIFPVAGLSVIHSVSNIIKF